LIQPNHHRCNHSTEGISIHSSTPLGSENQKAEKVKNEIAACVELKTVSSRLPEAIERDRQAPMASLLELQADHAAEMKLRKHLYIQVQELKGSIRVYCRVRPMVDSAQKAKYQE